MLLIVLLIVSLVMATVYSREGEPGPLHAIQGAVGSIAAPLKFVGASASSGMSDAQDALTDASADDATLSQLRELGQLLIQIHGQHAHQLLTKPEHQKTLLDGYTGEYALTQRMAEHYRQWHQSCRELAQHQQQSQERAARADLLQYQLKELNEFNPLPGEFEQIDEEYKRLANSGQLLSTCQHALTVLADGEEANLQSQLYTAKQLVSELVGMDSKLSGVLDMLEEATIQLSEASDELRHYHDRLDLDPNRLFELFAPRKKEERNT